MPTIVGAMLGFLILKMEVATRALQHLIHTRINETLHHNISLYVLILDIEFPITLDSILCVFFNRAIRFLVGSYELEVLQAFKRDPQQA